MTIENCTFLTTENCTLSRGREGGQVGGGPLAGGHRAQVPTFREAAERTHQANLLRWRSRKVPSACDIGRQERSVTTWTVIELSFGRPRL